MDTKGREELTGMQAIQAYQSCPICLGEWTAGALVGRKQCIYDGFRRHLPPGSKGREKVLKYKGHRYQYRCKDNRPPPRRRNHDFVRGAVYLSTSAQPFAGHKTAPLLLNWPGFDWYRMNTPEPMHDAKNACDNAMTTIVGHVSNAGKYDSWKKDATHRKQSKTLGVFPDIWTADGATTAEGEPAAGATADGAAAEGEPAADLGPLPWRLSKENRLLLDDRTKSIIWPHKMERLYYRGASMWKKPCRMWKCRRKHRLLYHILPVQLRDQIPIFRDALLAFAWTMRQLEGQVYSFEQATKKGILPGSRSLHKQRIDKLKADLAKSLVLLAGCQPIANLIPTWHHFLHYGEYTKTHGILRWLWMMAFERQEVDSSVLLRGLEPFCIICFETAKYYSEIMASLYRYYDFHLFAGSTST